MSESSALHRTGPIVGIDLGTTNSLVGAMDAGFPVLIADADGHRLTPSVVSFEPSGKLEGARFDMWVGRNALPERVVRPERTVYSVKRLMGTRAGEVDTRDLPYSVGGAKGGPARVLIDGGEFSPEEISSWILRKLKADAETALGTPVSRAVITVPAYFNDAQRNATKEAGELAGFHVERILNEPTAAALAYGLDRLSEKSKIAVYDLGGGTFDISILELNAGVFQVLSTNGNTRLGGDDIDTALTAEVAARLAVSSGGAIKLEPASAHLGEAVRTAKRELSETMETQVSFPWQTHRTLTVLIKRAELETVARPIVERTRTHCLRALADAKLSPGELDAVILVGGATRMPLVRTLVAEIFGREPDTSQNPDEAVALGATIQAGILSGAVRDVVLLDVTPLSLGIETFGGLANVIIPRNTTIPAKAGEMFTNPVAGQRAMGIHVIQGERERAADNWTLGAFRPGIHPGSARRGAGGRAVRDRRGRYLARPRARHEDRPGKDRRGPQRRGRERRKGRGHDRRVRRACVR